MIGEQVFSRVVLKTRIYSDKFNNVIGFQPTSTSHPEIFVFFFTRTISPNAIIKSSVALKTKYYSDKFNH